MQPTQALTTDTLKQLAVVDNSMAELLDELEKTDFSDEASDMLVSKLQDVIRARQILIGRLVADPQFVDRNYLQAQANMTSEFEQRAKKVLAKREALLRGIRNSKRQINVYKSIDSNR
ncbi:flagella biosynthesis chaperone for FliD, FliT [Shewanella youngdeokensis]|uniref:Flagella biosynthesis chaperone for FliD, FliT n=1 Tax=Shewanella youngdeokensis TaxID=2999068 RepID=A0ABZ0K115_9GAMM|nr:flagella biosynthesis chaperone for FliD, FliT [Shewanella sp. DAU334]